MVLTLPFLPCVLFLLLLLCSSYVKSFSFSVPHQALLTRKDGFRQKCYHDTMMKLPIKMENERSSSKFKSLDGIRRNGRSRASSFLQSSSVDSSEDRLPQRKPEIVGDEDIFCNVITCNCGYISKIHSFICIYKSL